MRPIKPEDIINEIAEIWPENYDFNEIDKFFVQVRKAVTHLRTPVALFFLVILIPYLLNISGNMTTAYIEKITGNIPYKDKWTHIKQINNIVVNNYDFSELMNHRIVVATILNVREKPTRKSKCLGKLEVGNTILLLKRNKSWSLISYYDKEEGEHIEGWVFSRYLVKFEK